MNSRTLTFGQRPAVRNRAYIETVPVEVTNGEFRIVFTRQVENPAIKAIEIVPQAEAAAGAASSAATIRIKAGPVRAIHGFERPGLAAGYRF